MLSRMLIDQRQFDAWASGTKPRNTILLCVFLLVLAAICIAAIAIMGPRLAREGTLLWFGTRTDGTVQQIRLEKVGTFKGGAPKYLLTIGYRFRDVDGRQYTGLTVRTDVRTPPSLSQGDEFGVYYNPSEPTNSVAEYNLRVDVYALLLFLPFLGVVGIGGALFYGVRLWNWRK
jgi:hypothetical protein